MKPWTQLVIAGSLLACSSNVEIPNDQPATTSGPTYYKDVAPILKEKCASCHEKGSLAPFTLGSFEDAKRVAAAIVEETSARRMPPWGAQSSDECKPPFAWQHDQRLTAQQIATLAAWQTAGAPAGDPNDEPRVETRPLDRLVNANIEMAPTAPYVARGDRDKFVCFILDPGITEDTWIRGVHVVPRNRKVVHHAVVTADPKRKALEHAKIGEAFDCSGGEGMDDGQIALDVWTPGVMPIELPENIGTPVPKGSLIINQIHYSPGGAVADPDVTKVQLQFSKKKPAFYLFTTAFGNLGAKLPNGDGLLAGPNDRSIAPEFRIPANVSSHIERMQSTIPESLDGTNPTPPLYLYGVMAHQHLAGVDVKVDLQRKGTTSASDLCLLQDKWDFHWQRMYTYDAPVTALPLLLPGDRIKLRCTYNNTMENPRLASELVARKLPVHDLALGEETLDEMCLAIPQILVPSW